MASRIGELLNLIYNENADVDAFAYVESFTRDCNKNQYTNILSWMRDLNYNDFHGKEIVPVIERLIKNGNLLSFRFGREYSPVIYLTVHNWDSQAKRSLTDEQFERRKKNVARSFEFCGDKIEYIYERQSANMLEHKVKNAVLRVWFD